MTTFLPRNSAQSDANGPAWHAKSSRPGRDAVSVSYRIAMRRYEGGGFATANPYISLSRPCCSPARLLAYNGGGGILTYLLELISGNETHSQVGLGFLE